MAEKVQVSADKLKVLSAVMDKIEKDFGKGSIMRMSSEAVTDIPVIPTGLCHWHAHSERHLRHDCKQVLQRSLQTGKVAKDLPKEGRQTD